MIEEALFSTREELKQQSRMLILAQRKADKDGIELLSLRTKSEEDTKEKAAL